MRKQECGFNRTVDGRWMVQFVCQSKGTDEQHPDPGGYGPFSVPLERYQARKVGLS